MAKKSESTPQANLPCGQCNYANEPERVYCHNCGAKLDRSLLPAPAERAEKPETPEDARKRISKMTNPKGGGPLQVVKMAVNVLIYSALLAFVFLISRKPDGVPAPSKELEQRMIGGELMDAMDAPRPVRLDFNEAEVNGYLQQSLKSKDGGAFGMEFKRAFVRMEPGAICIGSESSLFDLPVYSGVIYRIEVKDGKFTATLLGGSFGRLAVHPMAMKYLDTMFQKLWALLARERKDMDRMQTVIVDKGKITLVTKPGVR